MIGGCGAAGSLDTMFTATPADLFAFAGLTGAVNWTPTAAYAAVATSARTAVTLSPTNSFLRNLSSSISDHLHCGGPSPRTLQKGSRPAMRAGSTLRSYFLHFCETGVFTTSPVRK